MKSLLSILVLVMFFPASSGAEELSLPTDIKAFFVHRTVEDAWGRKSHNGIYCYAVTQKGVVGPFVDIYVVQDDKVVDMVSQGSNGKELIERIRKIGLRPFDYTEEVDKTIKSLVDEYNKQGKKYHPPMVLDGYTYDIIYDLDNTRLEIFSDNPGHVIAGLAPYNENIGKLYSVYKELMLYYAERKFHFK